MNDRQRAAEQKRAKRRFRNLGRTIPDGMLRFAGLKRVGLVDDADYGPSIHLGCRPWELNHGIIDVEMHDGKKLKVSV